MSITLNNLPQKRFFSAAVLFVLIANLIIGGILLPYKNAQAAAIVHDVLAYIQDAAKWAWERIEDAYHAAGTWFSATIDVWDKEDTILTKVIKTAWDRMRRMMLNMLVNDIVKWIQGGGKPRFITDWKGFLETAADKAAGDFITQDLGAGFLCGPFSVTLQIALAQPPTFSESVKCTLSEAIENVDDFFANFSNGGWKAWLAVSEPNNNIFGADLMIMDKKYDVMAAAQRAAENIGLSGAGFLGQNVCVKWVADGVTSTQRRPPEELPLGSSCLRWETVTPGTIIGGTLQQAIGIDIPWLINSKEFTEYAGAIIDAVINRTIREGILALTASGEGTSDSAFGPGITTPAFVSVDSSPYAGAVSGNATIDSLIPQERLLKENLNKNLTEYQKNLDILNQVQAAQENAVLLLQQTSSVGCPLPAGCSVGAVTSTIQSNCDTTCPCESITTITRPFTISGLGSGILQQVITNRYTRASTGTDLCDSLTYSSVKSSIISSSLSSSAKIAAAQTEMQTLQTQIAQTDTIIADSLAYQTASQAYIEYYEALLGGSGVAEDNGSSTEAITMQTAKNRLLVSLRVLTQNPSNNLSEHLSSVMDLSLTTVQKNSELQAQRGYSSDCSYAETGTYYGDLCAAEAKEAEIQDNYDSCSNNND